MTYEPQEGSGALFKNDKKGNDKRPDYRGDIYINGAMYSLSAWIKTAKNGAKFMSLNAQPKDAKPAAKKPMQSNVSGFDDMSDDIPW